eukprot:CAMPEP_0172406984 /NCGR_PEP_ID=MMETSP1061-20121228/72794_1 /TAXON_ID=37318 /ORGANISM="Pseudo-nitzschia pungens, Strain cf. pungens" /LENGTH=39 /DNA_ID= /DNA_START= /DNA_END= /DNA_ORIENTATION=
MNTYASPGSTVCNSQGIPSRMTWTNPTALPSTMAMAAES